MLKRTITHHASRDDDPETDSFYDTLVNLIDDLTHRVNADENAIEIEPDIHRIFIGLNHSEIF
jgi:hypothetical protein